MKTYGKSEFVPAKPHIKLTTGAVIKMLRELKGWTQAGACKAQRHHLYQYQPAGKRKGGDRQKARRAARKGFWRSSCHYYVPRVRGERDWQSGLTGIVKTSLSFRPERHPERSRRAKGRNLIHYNLWDASSFDRLRMLGMTLSESGLWK